MRITVAIYTGFFSIVVLIAILCSIISYTSYSDTVRQNLDESMEFAVQMLQVDRDKLYETNVDFNNYLDNKKVNVDLGSSTAKTEIEKKDALFKENFIRYLTTNLNSNVTKLDVKIYGANSDSGILSAEVTAYFQYPSGNVGYVTSYRTVILDKYLKEVGR